MRSFAWMQKIIHDYPIDVKEFDKIEREGKELLLITFEDLKQQRVLTLSQAAALIGNYLVGSQAYRPVGDGRSKEFVDQSLNQRVGGKVYATEPAIRTFITTLSTDITPEAIKATQTSPKESAALQGSCQIVYCSQRSILTM